MSDRILVKIKVHKRLVMFRTITRSRKSPPKFCVRQEDLAELVHTGGILLQNIDSFADFWLDTEGKAIMIHFTWLSRAENSEVRGWEQFVTLPYAALMAFVKDGARKNSPSEWQTLSMISERRPKLTFSGRENLHAVLENKTVRRKLVRFLRDNFQWKRTDEICFYNDFLPYSFTFQEFNSGCPGMRGGLILHEQKDLAKAYYSIHT